MLKKAVKYLFLIVLIISATFALTGCDLLDDLDDEEFETVENVSTNTYTLMIYMCGSDLESDGGYASDDIDEIINELKSLDF